MWVASGAAAESLANQVSREKGLQGRVMWIDAEANLWELSTRKGVADTVARCKDANINTIIVDVKPLSGLVLYKSKIAPRLTYYQGRKYPADYDLLRTVLEEGHKAGIAVHAAINVFSEGSQKVAGGPATKHVEWQAVQYDMDRTVSATDGTKLRLTCANVPYSQDQVCLYGADPDTAGKLPPNTVYVRVSKDGRPMICGTATGYARLSAPEGGYLLLGSGKAGEWLKSVADSKGRFDLQGTKVLATVGSSTAAHNAIFVNPLHPGARRYALSIIQEICRNYPVDGLVLDRMRYPNLYADFSDLTRTAFEKYIGHAVEHWPEDVYERGPVPGDIRQGPLFKSWLKFRAQVIRDFLSDARKVVKTARPKALLGIYVGSWYPLYYDVGVNWGSPNHRAGLDWWPDGYEQTGYADLLDYMMTGCYYSHPTRQDAIQHGDEEWKSVEAAAEESINAVKDATFVYGSLYLMQYQGRPEQFKQAIHECLEKTQGCMLFDLVYVRKYDWWDLLKQAFPQPRKAPHAVPGLLTRIRNSASREARK